MKPGTFVLIGALFPVYFVFLWVFVSFILSRVGGWSRMAKHYAAPSRPSGQNFSPVSARLGGTNYNNCLSATIADSGLFLQTWLIFRSFHQPLLIPWNALTPVRSEKFLWATRRVTEISLPDGGKVTLTIVSAGFGEALEEKLNNQSNAVEISAWSN